MDRHLLKLEPPYSIIYADGMIGRHMAAHCQHHLHGLYSGKQP